MKTMKLNIRRQRKGFTLIELLIVIAVIAILAAIAIPNLLSSREAANEASAIGTMRTINTAEATYRTRKGAYGALGDLGAANMVDPAVSAAATAPKSGYTFAVTVDTPSTQYHVLGTPQSNAGTESFYTDQTGVIWQCANPAQSNPGQMSGNPGGTWSQVGQ